MNTSPCSLVRILAAAAVVAMAFDQREERKALPANICDVTHALDG